MHLTLTHPDESISVIARCNSCIAWFLDIKYSDIERHYAKKLID